MTTTIQTASLLPVQPGTPAPVASSCSYLRSLMAGAAVPRTAWPSAGDVGPVATFLLAIQQDPHLRHTATDADLLQVTAAELGIEFGVRVDRAAIVATTGRLLAVSFDATAMAGPPADPVWVIAPCVRGWRDSPFFYDLHDAVSMIVQRRWTLVAATLQSAAAQLAISSPLDRLLCQRAVAANLSLAVTASHARLR